MSYYAMREEHNIRKNFSTNDVENYILFSYYLFFLHFFRLPLTF